MQTPAKLTRMVALALIALLLTFSSGCSISSLSDKLLKRSTNEAKLTADFVHIDEKAQTKVITDMIKGAKKSVYVEQYEFDRPDLINLLLDKAKQGVEVKVLLDKSPKVNKATFDKLRASGISVQYYPIEQGQASKAKLLAVDQTKAIIGGNDWSNAAITNRDVAIELNGRSAAKTASIFARDWKTTTTLELKVPESTEPEDYIVLATNANIQTYATRKVQEAKDSIQIEMNSLVYPEELLNQLADFAAGGKQVQIILDQAFDKTNKSSVTKLKASGAQVKFYPTAEPRKLSARYAIFDGKAVFLSSANWARSSFTMNHELGVYVPSKAVADKFTQMFNEDWQKAIEAK